VTRRSAFTLAETVITSGILLLMVAMTSLAIVSYLKSYRHYTQQGMRLRLAAKTLESASFRLRSAESFVIPLPSSLKERPLQFMERNSGPRALALENGKLVLRELDSKGGVLKASLVGTADDLLFELRGDRLQLTMPVPNQAIPLTTQVSLRGIRH
jgi:hypothetical protein